MVLNKDGAIPLATARHRRFQPLLALAAGATLALTACGALPSHAGGSTSRTGPIPVVAAENFYGDILDQICGTQCDVTSILSDPNADPHLYESNARNAVAVANARLVITNGEGYDTFMNHLMSASPNAHRAVINVQSLVGAADGANPHLWYDPTTMPKVAAAIVSDLSKIDPAHAAEYQAAETRFIASLQPITAEIAAIKSQDPGAAVAYTEPVFGYMGDALGLKVLTPESFQRAIEDGNDPTAADVAAEESLLSKHEVRVLIYNQQTVTPVTTNIVNLARADGVPVVGVTETEPPGETYQQWMLDELQSVQSALGRGATSSGQ